MHCSPAAASLIDELLIHGAGTRRQLSWRIDPEPLRRSPADMTAATGIGPSVYARWMVRRSSRSSGEAASSILHAMKRSVPAAHG